MAKIDKKIMAFIGTEDSSKLVHALSEYTDDIYAAIASEYGKATHPGGNITLLSTYLDEDAMKRWIERVGIEIIIDGTDLTASEPRNVIKKVCSEMNLEYLRVSDHYELNLNTEIHRSADEFPRIVEYAVGNVLVCGNDEIYKKIAESDSFIDKVIPMIPVNPEKISKLIDMGYPRENIICTDRNFKAEFLIAMFKELNITNFILLGSEKAGLAEKLEAINRSMVKAAVYGEIEDGEGKSADDLWDMLAERFGIEDY